MKLTSEFSLRYMAGEYVLMPQGDAILSDVRPVVVNETMAEIIKQVMDGMDVLSLLTYLQTEYGLEASDAQNALAEIKEELYRQGITEI